MANFLSRPSPIPNMHRIGERAIHSQRRAPGYHEHDAPDGVQLAPIAGKAVAGEVEHVLLVGREVQFEGCALTDLPGEVAGRAEGQLDSLTGPFRERLGDLGECELEIGSRGDDGWLGCG
jgi:hypothetical protein